MKTKEELNAIKEDVETLNKKLKELTEEELNQVTGGGSEQIGYAAELSAFSTAHYYCRECGYDFGENTPCARRSAKEYCPNCNKMVYVKR